MKVDAEPLGDDPLEVDPTPAHDAVELKIQLSMSPSGPEALKRRSGAWTGRRCATGSIALGYLSPQQFEDRNSRPIGGGMETTSVVDLVDKSRKVAGDVGEGFVGHRIDSFPKS
jgi:hypothetical protein